MYIALYSSAKSLMKKQMTNDAQDYQFSQLK